jgi:predicted kinase
MPNNEQDIKSPAIYVFFGMIATGKSSVCQAWAWHKQLRCFNSDWIRKELAGVDPTRKNPENIDKGIYTKEFSQKTYKTLLDRAETRIKNGDSVVLDASYQYARNRQDVRDLAKNLGCQVYFIFCQCPESVMKQRMDAREKDPASVSDGRWEIYLKQKERFEPPDEIPASQLFILNTTAPVEELLEELIEKLP